MPFLLFSKFLYISIKTAFSFDCVSEVGGEYSFSLAVDYPKM